MSNPWTSESAEVLRDVADCLAEIVKNYEARTGRRDVGQGIPTHDELAEITKAVFWASLRPDEGRYSCFTIVFAPPAPGCFRIAEVPLTPDALARLAPVAVSEGRIGVYRRESGGLVVWGINPGTTTYFEVRAVAPGHAVLSIAYQNLAVLFRDQVRGLVRRDPNTHERHGLGLDHLIAIVRRAFTTTQSLQDRTITATVLLIVAEEIRALRHGGTLLVLPEDEAHANTAGQLLSMGSCRLVEEVVLDAYKELGDAAARVDEPIAGLAESHVGSYLLRKPEGLMNPFVRACRGIGSLASVDGAIVVTDRLALLGFGATIRTPGSAQQATIRRRSLLDTDGDGRDVDISSLGGTRRQSAARFVANAYDSVALTVSHDGPLTLAFWAGDPPRPHLLTDLEMFLD